MDDSAAPSPRPVPPTVSPSPAGLCVVLVHYFTPDLLAACVRSIVDTTRDLAGSLRIVVVDNGSAEADRPGIDALPVAVLRTGENLGYAAAINLAVARQPAEIYVVMNPDIEVAEGCIARLAATVAESRGFAGPKLYLDRSRRFMLPPAERRDFPSEVLRLLADSRPAAAGVARRRWRRHVRRHWTAQAPVGSHDLSGAMMAISAEALRRVGPFDEGFRLYFEETDWQRRARRAGVAGHYVPQAHAAHFFNQSAAKEPSAPGWFRDSELRFRGKHYGRLGAAILSWLDSFKRAALDEERLAPPALADAIAAADLGTAAPLWLEVAHSPTGFPAAARQGQSARELAREAAALLPAVGVHGRIWTIVDGAGTELRRWRVDVDVGG